MKVEDYVRTFGGLAHRSLLRQRGVSAYRLRLLIDAGRLVRVGRDRVAVPDCPPALITAGSLGARVGCVSAARLRGLWVPNDDERLHLAVPRDFSRALPPKTPPTVLHHSRTPVPMGVGQVVDVLPNVLVHVARCQIHELAVAMFDSALNRGLIGLKELCAIGEHQSARFRAVVDSCDGRADAGNESILRVRLRRIGIAMVPQVRIDGHPVDGLIGERLVIQTDGFGPHSDPVQRARDLRQDNRLRLIGYEALRFSAMQIFTSWDYVEDSITRAVAQGWHLWS